MPAAQKAQSPRVSRPGYEISYEPATKRVRVQFNGITVGDSPHAMIVRETRQPPVYYFPREHVRMDLMYPTRKHTHCPFRGNASYWTLKAGERIVENAAWSYETPFEDAAVIRSYVAFYGEQMDAIYEADRKTRTAVDNTYTNPLVDWLLRDAWDIPTSRELVRQFAQTLVAADIPLWRLWLTIRVLHPQLLSTGYEWQAGDDDVEERGVTYSVLEEERYLQSPLVPIFDGAGGVRRRLDIANPQLDYPIVKELQASGATDYVAMPLLFSDGQINAISLTSKHPGGFSAEHLGYVYEVLPLLSRLFEVHNTRRTASNLLNTYLGKQSGEKVLRGLIKRGDGEHIHAVIWFCDLRGSTTLADSMPREQFLQILNQFFECMAGAVLDHDGEVLRFIGDAVLAIFPIADPGDNGVDIDSLTAQACDAAMTAAHDAEQRIKNLNQEHSRRGEPPLEYGIGLHVGDVMYGNIGTPERLEFSVIGAAANEAARIESMCKKLKQTLLVSAEFAHRYRGELQSLGRHELRGVGSAHELFTLATA
ncbi:MAG: DUF427 domain-containing protein [Gammaproteobacteria bacterium]